MYTCVAAHKYVHDKSHALNRDMSHFIRTAIRPDTKS